MNWYFTMKLAAGDVLANIRMLIDDRQSGIKAQINTMMRDPQVQHLFTDHIVQRHLVSITAAIDKTLELASRYSDYKTALERLRSAYSGVSELCKVINQKLGVNFASKPAVNTLLSDMRSVFNELHMLAGAGRKAPPQQNNNRQNPNAPTSPIPMQQPQPQKSPMQMPSPAAQPQQNIAM